MHTTSCYTRAETFIPRALCDYILRAKLSPVSIVSGVPSDWPVVCEIQFPEHFSAPLAENRSIVLPAVRAKNTSISSGPFIVRAVAVHEPVSC